MKTHSFLSAAALVLLLHIPNVASAQVLIPDTLMRNWLNTQIPGIVDENGIMDTLNPAIAAVDSASFSISSDIWVDTLDLEGVQYMDSLRDFRVTLSPANNIGIITCGAVPPGLRSFDFSSNSSHGTFLYLGQMPTFMDDLVFESGNGSDGCGLEIQQLPQQINNFRITEFETLSWQGSAHASNLTIEAQSLTLNTIIPSISAGSTTITGTTISNLNLIPIETDSLYIWGSLIIGPILFPEYLHTLDIVETNFQYPLQSFPPTLQTLLFWGGYYDQCLPWLPDSLSSFYFDQQISYTCLPNWPSGLDMIHTVDGDFTSAEVNYCSVLNSDCPGIYPGISGTIYVDLNENGIHDVGEPPLPQTSVTVQPGSNVAPCDDQGYWQIGVPPGSYMITPSSSYPYIASITPAQHTADLPSMGSADTLNDFAVTLTPNIEDLQALIYAFPARPGFDNEVHLTCRNYGTVPMDAQITFQFDTDQNWVGSSIAPDILTGNTATWNLNGMAIGATTNIVVDLHTATTVSLGTGIDHMLTALPDLTDETPADNTVLWTDSVVGSYDPNDKLLSPATMTPADVQANHKRIEYVIRYQNTGTAAAERVVIADTLPAGLQLESIRFDGSSLPCSWYLEGGVLYFVHEGIDLPDSTSDQLGSQGFVRFSILPATDLVNGETVTNIAHIVFDFNEPVVTPPAVFTVDATTVIAENSAPAIRVIPNPAHDHLFISFPNGEHPSAVLVRDAMGRIALRPELTKEGAVDVSTLPTGLYILEATSKGSTAQVRFVKQ